MAVILDESARAVVAERRRRGKDDRIYLRLERGSMRASTPLTLVAGWAPRDVPDGAGEYRIAGDVVVYMGLRVARYALSRDVVISGFQLWRWQRLVLADPFAYEHMREWEYTRTRTGSRSSASAVSTVDLGSPTDSQDNVIESTVLAQARSKHTIVERERGHERA